MRREEHHVGRRAMDMKVQGRRKSGRPKIIRLDKEKGLSPVLLPGVVCHRTSTYIKVGIR